MNNHSERGHALLSASSAHRWLACPPSAVAAEAYPAQDTEFTREGTLAHEVAEIVVRTAMEGGDEYQFPQPEEVTMEMVASAEAYADYIQELKTSDDAIVLLEQRVDFSPWVPEGFGTCDCILIQGNVLTIVDYKYGQGVAVSAEDNPQMKLYALGALNDYGIALDVSRVETHIFQPRLNNISTCGLMVEDLLDWAKKSVKPTAEKAFKGKGTYCAGEHCRFCPHAGRCRTLAKICTEYVETHDLRVAVPVLAPHELADALCMEPLIQIWLKRIKSQAMTTLLDGGEIPGWKVVEGKLGNRKWINEIAVAEALKIAGYSREEITETKLLSPSQMDKVLGKKKAAELLENLIDRAPGAPTLAPASDKRPAYDRLAEAQNDFN